MSDPERPVGDPVGAGARSAPPEGPAPSALPCLDSNNSTEGTPEAGLTPKEFPSAAKRTAFALQLNVAGFVQRHGLERCGFLTLTFADHVTNPEESQRRLNSLMTHVLRPRYGDAVRIYERMKSGRIHYHLLVPVQVDIRTGVDFAAIGAGDYRSAGAALRAEWAFWRRTAKLYGFGRTELLPIKSTEEAVAKYLGKYIAKHFDAREEADKGVRLVAYSGRRVATTRFAWASPGAALWRAKLRGFVQCLVDSDALPEPTFAAMRKKFGKRWAYKLRDVIAAFPVEV